MLRKEKQYKKLALIFPFPQLKQKIFQEFRLSARLDKMIARGLFQLKLFYDSMI